MSIKKKLYKHFKENGLKSYANHELTAIANSISWPRVLRQMRQDKIIDYDVNRSEREYLLTKINSLKTNPIRQQINAKQRYAISHRDGHRCQSCGKGVKDGVKLHIDHKIPVEMGGDNSDSNLWTLCEDCNQGKKAFFKDDLNAEIMTEVFKEKSGYQKLKTLFELSPNVKYSPTIIQGIAGIRDWTRAIRLIRQKESLNISWFEPDAEFSSGYYSNIV